MTSTDSLDIFNPTGNVQFLIPRAPTSSTCVSFGRVIMKLYMETDSSLGCVYRNITMCTINQPHGI